MAFGMDEFMRAAGFGMGGFSPFGRAGSQARAKPKPDFRRDGQHARIAASVSFAEMVHGCSKSFTVKLSKPCAVCGGTGSEDKSEPKLCPSCHGTGSRVETAERGPMVVQTIVPCRNCDGTGWKTDPCRACGGSGKQPAEKAVRIEIPAGIEDRQRLRLPGQGHCGLCGGRDGDLYVDVHVQDFSTLFTRHGLDCETSVYVSPAVMALGGKAMAWSPFGKVDVEVPACSAPGRRIELPGHGFQDKTGHRGSLTAVVKPAKLANLSQYQRELLEKFDASLMADNLPEAEALSMEAAGLGLGA